MRYATWIMPGDGSFEDLSTRAQIKICLCACVHVHVLHTTHQLDIGLTLNIYPGSPYCKGQYALGLTIGFGQLAIKYMSAYVLEGKTK